MKLQIDCYKRVSIGNRNYCVSRLYVDGVYKRDIMLPPVIIKRTE